MAAFTYRLQTLLDQKVEAKKQAQSGVGVALREVEQAKEMLEELRNKERALHDKKEQLRRSLFSSGPGQALGATDLRSRAAYLKRMDQEIEEAGADVFGQRIVVDECEDALQQARRLLADAARGVEILEKHKAKLAERFQRELQHREALELDEAGTAAFLRRRREDAR